MRFIVNQILAKHPELNDNLFAIGHRVVHGGEKFTSSVVITDEVVQGIEECVALAPLHNPAHLVGIKAAQHYGAIRAALEKLGQPIGVNDIHIAGHARSEGLALVTNNVAEFIRVPALEVENWVSRA